MQDNNVQYLIDSCVKLSNVSDRFFTNECSITSVVKSNEICCFNYYGVEYIYTPATGVVYNGCVYSIPKHDINLSYCDIVLTMPMQAIESNMIAAASNFNVIDIATGFNINYISGDFININVLSECKLQKNIDFFINPTVNFLNSDSCEINSLMLYAAALLNNSEIVKENNCDFIAHGSTDKSFFIIDLLNESSCYSYSGINTGWNYSFSKSEVKDFSNIISYQSNSPTTYRYLSANEDSSNFNINKNLLNEQVVINKKYKFQHIQPVCISSNFPITIMSNFVEDTTGISSGIFNMKYDINNYMTCKIRFISPEFTKIDSIFWIDGFGADKVLYKQSHQSNDGYLYSNVAQINFELQHLSLLNSKDYENNRILGRICVNVGGNL